MSENKKSAEQIEQERLTRRQALRKLGFGAGLSAIMLLGADDLARMVGKRIEQMAGDNKIAEQIAKEFRSAGVAFAAGPSISCGQPCQYCGGIFATECDHGARASGAPTLTGVQCCQKACDDCCAKTPSGNLPCGIRTDAAITACHTQCANYFKSGV